MKSIDFPKYIIELALQRLRFDQIGHTNPKRIVKRMTQSTSLLDWPIDFRNAVSTHLGSAKSIVVHVTNVLPFAYTIVMIGLRYCRSIGSNLSRIDMMTEIMY